MIEQSRIIECWIGDSNDGVKGKKYHFLKRRVRGIEYVSYPFIFFPPYHFFLSPSCYFIISSFVIASFYPVISSFLGISFHPFISPVLVTPFDFSFRYCLILSRNFSSPCYFVLPLHFSSPCYFVSFRL